MTTAMRRKEDPQVKESRDESPHSVVVKPFFSE
jgi:hypothetical protein